jgi:hypothetical protein
MPSCHKVEDVVQQTQEHFGRVLGGLEIIADLRREILQQGQLGHAEDRAQRSAQLVAEVGHDLQARPIRRRIHTENAFTSWE